MKKLLLAAALTLSLAGCATLQQDIQTVKTTVQQSLTPDNFDTVTALYGATLSIAVSYRRLCQTKAIDKSCWKTISKLQPYEAKSYATYIVLKDFVKNNPNADASSLIALAKNAITAFRSAQSSNGVN